MPWWCSIVTWQTTYHFFCFNAIELMPTVTTPIDVAKRASITDVTSNERYSLHNVSMNHLLIRHTDTSHTHIQHTILTDFSSYCRLGHVPQNRTYGDNQSRFLLVSAALVIQSTALKHWKKLKASTQTNDR